MKAALRGQQEVRAGGTLAPRSCGKCKCKPSGWAVFYLDGTLPGPKVTSEGGTARAVRVAVAIVLNDIQSRAS